MKHAAVSEPAGPVLLHSDVDLSDPRVYVKQKCSEAVNNQTEANGGFTLFSFTLADKAVVRQPSILSVRSYFLKLYELNPCNYKLGSVHSDAVRPEAGILVTKCTQCEADAVPRRLCFLLDDCKKTAPCSRP